MFIIIDNFSKYLWCILPKHKNSQSITSEFSNNLTTSKRSPLEIESDRGKKWCNSTFQNFLKFKNLHHYSRVIDEGPFVVERVLRSVLNSLKKPIFAKENTDWLSELPTDFKQNNNTIHHKIKMTPIQASKKINGKLVYSNLRDDREIQKPK